MKRTLFLLLLPLLLLTAVPDSAYAQEAPGNTTCAYFFYGDGCPHCARVEPFMAQMEEKHPQLEIYEFEIYRNSENARLLNSFFEAYGIPQGERGVPIIFISDTYMAGDRPIIENLEAKIQGLSGTGAPCPLPQPVSASGVSEKFSTSGLSMDLPKLLAVATGAAIVDSINPCAIAVLLILLMALLATGERGRALKTGLAFTASIYIVYFLFGLGLFHTLQISGLSSWFYQVLGGFAVLVGLLNIKDYLWYGGGGFVMEIPRSWRPRLKGLLQGVTSPAGAFLMGFVVCLFELPCTGGPYLFMTGLLAQQVTQTIAIPVLLYYNVIFVLPLIGIIAALYFGMSKIEEMEKWRTEKIRVLHLVAGLIMVALGIAVAMRLV